ncbi:hypothetical protein TeGR_g12508, partial [Tetraparma gracilis]
YLEALALRIAGGEEVEEHVDGVDCLMIAAESGHEEAVKYFLEKGADPRKTDDDDKTALTNAVKGNFGEVAAILVAAGADPDTEFVDEEGVSHNLLMDSIIVENDEFARLLIENGADVTHKDEAGVTTLLQAAHRGLGDIVELLLKKGGVDVDEGNDDGITPIIAAASEGHDAIVDLLVGTGKCDLNKVDKDGTNPLMAASVRGHASIVKKLLSGGSGLNAQNSDGHTALMFAYNGKNQVAMLWDQYKEMLAEAGEEDVEDNAKLIKEALDNHTAVIDLLAASGADATIKDSEGHTAADFDYNPDLDADLVEGEKKSADRRSKSKNEL